MATCCFIFNASQLFIFYFLFLYCHPTCMGKFFMNFQNIFAHALKSLMHSLKWVSCTKILNVFVFLPHVCFTLRSLHISWFYQPNIISLGYKNAKILNEHFECNLELCRNEQVTLTEIHVQSLKYNTFMYFVWLKPTRIIFLPNFYRTRTALFVR